MIEDNFLEMIKLLGKMVEKNTKDIKKLKTFANDIWHIFQYKSKRDFKQETTQFQVSNLPNPTFTN